MSTSMPSAGHLQASTDHDLTFDWQAPFGLVTTALVLAGATSVLRLVFTGSLKWAEAVAFIFLFCWCYWANKFGLFPRRRSRYKFPSLPQALLNGFAWFVFFCALDTWLGDRPTTNRWIGSAVIALVAGFLISPGRSTPPPKEH